MSTQYGDGAPWLLTASGIKFPLIDPKPEHVLLHDIAYALGNLCRFTGHTKRLYTVAEHCVLVALILREQGHDSDTQLLGLLHDSAEAYVGDLSHPLKKAMQSVEPGIYSFDGTSAFRKVERGVVNAILTRFMLHTPEGDEFGGVVKQADYIAGITEARDLVGDVMWTEMPIKPYVHHVDAALLWAQWLYVGNLDEVLTPAELYKAVFKALA